MQTYRTALVTGASSGIGEAAARALAATGCDLVLVARRVDRLRHVGAELRARHGVHVEVIVADLTAPDQLGVVADRAADPARPVDLLVNGAGIRGVSPFVTADLATEAEKVQVNVLALLRLTRAVLPGMLDRGRGGVLNVSSAGGFLPAPQAATYGATKAFVIAFSENLHCETRHRGVHVSALCPGFVRRLAHQSNREPGPRWLPPAWWLDPDEVVRDGLRAVAAGRPVCLPGVRYRVLVILARLLPRRLVLAAFERFWGRSTVRR